MLCLAGKFMNRAVPSRQLLADCCLGARIRRGANGLQSELRSIRSKTAGDRGMNHQHVPSWTHPNIARRVVRLLKS